jgi:hypothetical protein
MIHVPDLATHLPSGVFATEYHKSRPKRQGKLTAYRYALMGFRLGRWYFSCFLCLLRCVSVL